MKKVLITGGNGQLGQSILKRIKDNDITEFSFLFTDYEDLDITDNNSVDDFFYEKSIDYVINCAAYTAVDKAEEDIETAYKINAEAVEILAKTCNKFNSTLIHISTDYVFSGEEETPRIESDPTNPIGIYGKSKLDGENFALEKNPKTYIIRTAWLYSPYGNNFVKTMINLFNIKDEIRVINDQKGSPTNALDLADIILNIIQNDNNKYGIYHYSNEGKCTWFEFAEEIKKQIKSKINISAISTNEYPTLAKRPKYSLLNKSKIKTTFNIDIPDWKDSLKNCLLQIDNKNL